MSKDRGFKKLVGKTIKSVNTKAVNEVLLIDGDGDTYAIEVEVQYPGIPIISLKKVDVKKTKAAVKEKTTKRNTKAWPFPLEKDNSLD